jgi:hypothetical protein
MTTPISNACAACAAGGTVEFPDGTYLFSISATGTPEVQLTKAITIDLGGATLKASGTTPTTVAQEQGQYLFQFSGVTGARVIGGQFDAQKGAGTDPVCGLVKFVGCVDARVSGTRFYDSSKNASGLVYFESYNGVSSTATEGSVVSGLTFERCSWGILFRNVWRNVTVTDCTYIEGELAAPNSGLTRYSTTVYPGRAIRFTGYINGESSTSDGDIGFATVSNNNIEHATYGVEVWNQDATAGRNPDNATNITVTNNNVKALFGIGVNSFSKVSISGNTVRHLSLSTAQMTAYAGSKDLTNTSSAGGNDAGSMIEARPGYAHTVFGNSIDLSYDPSASPDLTASSAAISIGNSGFNIDCEAIVSGNYIRKAYNGISCGATQDTTVDGNTFDLCRRSIECDTSWTNTSGFSGNTFSNNTIYGYAAATLNTQNTRIYGDWTINGNQFKGAATDEVSTPFLGLDYTSGVYVVTGNYFINYNGEAVKDSGLTSTYDGNVYDPGTGTGTNGAVSFLRQNNKAVVIGTEKVLGGSAAYGWRGSAGTGESYSANTVLINGDTGSFSKSVSSGTVYDMAAHCGFKSAAPTGGTWSQGNIFYDSTPSAGGTMGWVCTTSGTPGTWKTFGAITA